MRGLVNQWDMLCSVSSPVCEVVVGVGHVDEPLDEVGTLDEAEEHLQTADTSDTQLSLTRTFVTHLTAPLPR